MSHTNRRTRLLALLAAATVALAACAGTEPGASPTAASTEPPATPTPDAASPEPASPEPMSPDPATDAPAGDATIQVAESALGDIVVDAEGRALYMFDNDTQGSGTSACADACLSSWPVLAAPDGGATAGAGISGELGTATATDGTTMVTLNGWPLYYFAGDTTPGQTNGQGVGDVWWVLTPAGEPMRGGTTGVDGY